MVHPYSPPVTSPPTPSRASDIMSTRSGHGMISKALAPKSTRIEKPSTKKKKKERAKPAKNVPVLDRPMSELTKESAIPVADIDTYVHRSAQQRQEEVQTCKKNPGKVKRPMNAFMLYRKAYQQRAKEWASQHNHQVVSRVCGSSWPLEPEHIRHQFKTWADIERDNHQKAHPNYKFTPSKPHKAAKYEEPFDGSEASDLEEFGEWQSHSRMRSATNTPNDDREYIPSRSLYASAHHQHLMGLHAGLGGQDHQSRNVFDFSNPGKSVPSAYDSRDFNHFFDTQARGSSRHLHADMMENMMMRKTPPSPSMAFQTTPHGLQSHHPYDLSQYHHTAVEPPSQLSTHPHSHSHVHSQSQPQRFEHRIDPSLMSEDLFSQSNTLNHTLNPLFDGGGFGGGSQQAWQSSQLSTNHEAEEQYSNFMGLNETLSVEQTTAYLKNTDDWQMETLPAETHFETSWTDTKTEQ
ncbi:hypothetical protein QBC35DRAFT_482850 [Podospora australis]|uniref:HMG box domain-containing protein n=1 Tax=Podospora australis TaxID=1536484 RepID=A0AAN6X5S5_9PEZI|nr:hypothetical protein QBC35DRAFT_482850 [Podospora australis]